MKNESCPCCSGHVFSTCCEPYLNHAKPETPEQLMRSRYTAYTLQNWVYLYKTWDKSTRPPLPQLKQSDPVTWIGLKIIESAYANDDEGTVEFVASYETNGQLLQIHERSYFVKNTSRWVYVHGDQF